MTVGMSLLVWHCRGLTLDPGTRPVVQGIVNVTPDSFSDGGEFGDPGRAVEHALKLAAEGADLLDIGGESTRPGATPVTLDEELRRVIPVIERVAKQCPVPISVDTMKPEVARAAVDVGAVVINDVSGFRDPAMVRVAAKSGAGLIVMHMPGTPRTMNDSPHYDDVAGEVAEYLRGQLAMLAEAGVNPQCVAVDPGIGFGKFTDHSLSLVANLGTVAALNRPVVLGVSRKGFLGRVTGREVGDRMPAGLAVACYAMARGTAHVFRVHDVGPTVDAVKMFTAIVSARDLA
jgi:dihydropteroate synthase